MNFTEGDVKLLSTVDGGNINVDSGLTEMTGGFESMIYLCLFGGNFEDDGTESTKNLEWWGNKIDNDPDKNLTSRTQNILKGFPATPGNLNLVDQAIKLDLNIMLTTGIIDDLIINLSIPAKNRIQIDIEGRKDKTKLFNTVYEENWVAQSSGV